MAAPGPGLAAGGTWTRKAHPARTGRGAHAALPPRPDRPGPPPAGPVPRVRDGRPPGSGQRPPRGATRRRASVPVRGPGPRPAATPPSAQPQPRGLAGCAHPEPSGAAGVWRRGRRPRPGSRPPTAGPLRGGGRCPWDAAAPRAVAAGRRRSPAAPPGTGRGPHRRHGAAQPGQADAGLAAAGGPAPPPGRGPVCGDCATFRRGAPLPWSPPTRGSRPEVRLCAAGAAPR